jgi:hypothetical protein
MARVGRLIAARVTKLVLRAVLAAAMAAVPLSGEAKCGTGQPISYDDIQAVMLTSRYRTSDGYHAKWSGITGLASSSYWVFFWRYSPTQYSQYNLVGAVGSYTLDAKLADAVDILQRDHFFDLSNPYFMVTDASQSVLTVLSCSIVTRIIVYNGPEYQDPSVAKVLSDLRDLVVQSKKNVTSTSPTDFEQTLLFDP